MTRGGSPRRGRASGSPAKREHAIMRRRDQRSASPARRAAIGWRMRWWQWKMSGIDLALATHAAAGSSRGPFTYRRPMPRPSTSPAMARAIAGMLDPNRATSAETLAPLRVFATRDEIHRKATCTDLIRIRAAAGKHHARAPPAGMDERQQLQLIFKAK